jgi:endogenous inhibitor of DNA gyrase (YacG/DUF329 family)
MKCPNCHSVIAPDAAWKSSANRFYCSEFCADIEIQDASSSSVSKDEIDRQYIERLQRLLPYVRRRAAALPLVSDAPGIG